MLRSNPGRVDVSASGSGASQEPQATPAIDTSIYAAGQVMGGKLTLATAVESAASGGVIGTVTITDKAKQNAAIAVVFFNADPSATTFTNHSALTVNAADQAKIIGHVVLAAAEYLSLSNIAVGTHPNAGISFKLPAGTTLYACLISQGTPTYASASDLVLGVGILGD